MGIETARMVYVMLSKFFFFFSACKSALYSEEGLMLFNWSEYDSSFSNDSEAIRVWATMMVMVMLMMMIDVSSSVLRLRLRSRI